MPKTNTTLGVGIRGAGQVAIEHVKAINNNPHLHVAAVCSRREESAQALADEHAPGASVWPTYEEMLDAPGVDVVSICMPNYLHAREAIAALNADKHLILEKPPAITYEELAGLRAAARRSTKRTVVSFVLRWHPMIQEIRKALEADTIGEIYYAEADYWHGIKKTFASYPWIRQREYAGGAMITGGCHAADIIRHLTGKEVTEVFAYRTGAREDFDYPTTLAAAVRYNDDRVGKLSASLDGLYFPYQFNLDLLGTKGAIRDNRICAPFMEPPTAGFQELTAETPNSGTVAHHPFQQEIDDLADGIVNGTPITCELLDACNSIEIALAIERSAATGKPVAVKAE